MANKFIFINDNSDGDDDLFINRLEFTAEHVDDVISNFEIFLRGCGFYFDPATIQRVEPEDEFHSSLSHNEYFYDFDRNR